MIKKKYATILKKYSSNLIPCLTSTYLVCQLDQVNGRRAVSPGPNEPVAAMRIPEDLRS